MAWTIIPAHEAARRAALAQASIDQADAGAASSTLQLYGAVDPETSARPLLGTITLAKPCASITLDYKLQLIQADPTGDTVAATGIPEVAHWCNGDGTAIGSCTVGPAGSGADLTVTSRPDGMIFAGGYLTLVGGVIG